jgi:hypothetical protein
MKKLTFSRKNDLGQLLGEIEAAVPALRPRVVEGERQAVMCVGGEGEQIVVLVPDETGEADVAAVAVAVASHAPKPKVPPPDVRALWNTYKTNVQAATTAAQIKAALVNDLGPLLRAIARGHRGDLDGS